MAKRISQLTALTSASLDTTLLGIDRGTSYKIELDVLADAVKDRINTLDDIRLDSLENFTSSYETKGRNIVSGSSQLTSSFDTRYTLSGSIANVNTSSLVDRLTAIESVSGSWITESETGSFLTSLSGAISSSSQVIGILSSLNSVSASLISKTGSYATTGSNHFYGDQIIEGDSFVELQIGESYGGGIVFYVSPSLTLIVSNTDIATTNTFTKVSTASGSLIGIGDENTNAIIAVTGLEQNPAKYATDYTNGGFSDWYLPSINELSEAKLYSGVLSNDTFYWSSTKGDDDSQSPASQNNYMYGPGSYIRLVNSTTIGKEPTSGQSIFGGVVYMGTTAVRAIRQINTNLRPATTNNANVQITGSLSVSGSITGSTNFNTIVNKPSLISGSSQLTSSFDTRYAISASFVSSSNLSSIRTITSASYAALTPVSGTLYIIIG